MRTLSGRGAQEGSARRGEEGRDSWTKNGSGKPVNGRAPVPVVVVYALKTPAGRCQDAHRKSGVVIRPSNTCPAESYLLP